MNSAPEPESVLRDLGDPFLRALSGAVRGARTDIAEMRSWRPGWFPHMHTRTLANLIHDRVWNRFVEALGTADWATTVESGPTREIQVGTNYLLRIKRHTSQDQIRSYPTETDLEFWTNNQHQFPGLELTTLACGYRWDEETRQIQAPVISYRNAKDDPVWAVELTEEAGASGITWTPVTGPDLPALDFRSLGAEARADHE